MESTSLVIFNKSNTKDLLEQFDFKLVQRKIGTKSREYVAKKDGQIVTCHGCQKELTPRKVGTISHGSRLIFCDNPMCFATWVAQNKID